MEKLAEHLTSEEINTRLVWKRKMKQMFFVLWQHCLEHHDGIIQDFKMKVERRHRSLFERQIHEAVSIITDSSDIILNRKSEFNDQRLPRLAIEILDKVKQIDYDGHEIGKRARQNDDENDSSKKSKMDTKPSEKHQPREIKKLS